MRAHLRRVRPSIQVGLGIIVIGAVIVFSALTLRNETRSNTEGIEVTCLLLVQAIRDSGANAAHPSSAPGVVAQRRLTNLFRAQLMRDMSASDRARARGYIDIITRAGGTLPEPNCADAARDPAKVRRDTLQP